MKPFLSKPAGVEDARLSELLGPRSPVTSGSAGLTRYLADEARTDRNVCLPHCVVSGDAENTRSVSGRLHVDHAQDDHPDLIGKQVAAQVQVLHENCISKSE